MNAKEMVEKVLNGSSVIDVVNEQDIPTGWNHEGSDGADKVEWWIKKGNSIGVMKSRSTNGKFAVAYVNSGEPAGSTNRYETFSSLNDAINRALKLEKSER